MPINDEFVAIVQDLYHRAESELDEETITKVLKLLGDRWRREKNFNIYIDTGAIRYAGDKNDREKY